MRKIFPLLMGILMLVGNVFAQSQATTGNIEGRVADPQGAAVPGVSVTATNQDTFYSAQTINNRSRNKPVCSLSAKFSKTRPFQYNTRFSKEMI